MSKFLDELHKEMSDMGINRGVRVSAFKRSDRIIDPDKFAGDFSKSVAAPYVEYCKKKGIKLTGKEGLSSVLVKIKSFKIKTISITLSYKWFDLIKSGKKNSEYRASKPYWDTRLKELVPGDQIIFRRGYHPDLGGRVKTVKKTIKNIHKISYGRLLLKSLDAYFFLTQKTIPKQFWEIQLEKEIK